MTGAPTPIRAVSEAVYDALCAADQGPFANLSPEDQAQEDLLAEAYVSAHLGWLAQQGVRIVPPDAILKPTSEAEALAMVKAAKDFLDGQRRKGKLLGAASPSKLIMPGRAL